jgi:hypothetical protein
MPSPTLTYEQVVANAKASGADQSVLNSLANANRVNPTANFLPSTVATPTPASTPTNPVVSSTPQRADYTAVGNNIANLQAASQAQNAALEDYRIKLAQRRAAEVQGINAEYDIAKKAQEAGQTKSYAARSTNLITSGGGFLGGTQSQQGVLQNLQGTFEAEKTALFAKKEAAIRAALAAYDDKDFELARDMAKNAMDLEKEINKREMDFQDQALKVAAANRAQTEFDLGITDKKIESYTNMSDDEFAKVNPTEIAKMDALYYPGYTTNARAIAKKTKDLKTEKDALGIETDILDMRLKVPAGQKFQLNGVTYTGLKQKESGSVSEGDKKILLKEKVNTLFSPGYVVPGTATPIVDNNGFATPEGWKAVAKVSGISRDDFIKDYGYLIYQGNIGAYGLTGAERKLLTGI